MKQTFALLLTLLTVCSLHAQRVDKTLFWTRQGDSVLQRTIVSLPDSAPDLRYDSLCGVINSQIKSGRDVQRNMCSIIRLADKLEKENRYQQAEKILQTTITTAQKQGDTLNYAFSQLFSFRAILLRDQQKMKEALAPALSEIAVLRACDTAHPALLDAYTNLMTNYFALRKTEAGLRLAPKILSLAHQSGYRYYVVNTYRLMGDIFKFYQPSLGLECMVFADWLTKHYHPEGLSEDPYYCISMGSALIANDHPDSALRWFKRGLQLTRQLTGNQKRIFGFLYYYMAVSYKNMLVFDKGVTYIDSALAVDPGIKTTNPPGYYRFLHMKGKMLNQLELCDSALVINKEALDNTSTNISSFYTNAVEQYGRSLLGTGHLEEALSLVQKQICKMTSCSDTTGLPDITQYKHTVTPETDLRELSFIIGLKNEILAALYRKTGETKYRNAIIANMRYLLAVIDIEAGMSQTPDGLADLAQRYRLFADQIVDFFANQPATSSDTVMREVYPLVARSQAYSVICRSYALGSSNDSLLDATTVKLNHIREDLLNTDPDADAETYEALKGEEINILTRRYLENMNTGKSVAQILVPQMLPSENTRIENGIGPDEALIDYYSTKKYIARFIITNRHFDVFFQPLPSDFGTMCDNLTKAIKTGETVQTRRAAKYISMLLFNKVSGLKKKKRFTIIPDEKLYYIPFELLTLPGTDKMLIENHTLSYRYTSHLYRLPARKELVGPLAAFAPMTGSATSITSTRVRSNEIEDSGYGSIMDRGKRSFAPLPYSLAEVNDVADLFNRRGIKATVFTGARAGKKMLKQSIEEATIVHIATHGLVNRENPEKSGLVFAADTTGKTDAMLYMGEMFGMKAAPSLVVLSACKSGVGVLERGDGIMALPRGLIVAGAQNVVASLWNVNDMSTLPLMVGFYRHILNGDDYATALQKSKLECIAKGFLPIDWAGFVLIER